VTITPSPGGDDRETAILAESWPYGKAKAQGHEKHREQNGHSD
jgi:hypothetical protein